jgi:hypothetical protein
MIPRRSRGFSYQKGNVPFLARRAPQKTDIEVKKITGRKDRKKPLPSENDRINYLYKFYIVLT